MESSYAYPSNIDPSKKAAATPFDLALGTVRMAAEETGSKGGVARAVGDLGACDPPAVSLHQFTQDNRHRIKRTSEMRRARTNLPRNVRGRGILCSSSLLPGLPSYLLRDDHEHASLPVPTRTRNDLKKIW